MPINVANWNDKQLDELQDLLRTADHSVIAPFMAENFLCSGSRILTDSDQSQLRVTVNGSDQKAVDLSPGVFVHGGKVSHVDTTQTINILATSTGSWGTGKAAHATLNRWSIVCVKHNEMAHTPELRWFVDDSVEPNTYSQKQANTLINKSYYDIVVVHGIDAESPEIPNAPSGYWTIAEIYVPAGSTSISQSNVYDTVRASQKIPPNWTSDTRVLRLEFCSKMFGVDHSMTDGHHKYKGWYIGSDVVNSSANELNRLYGVGSSVTATNLTKLTDGTVLESGELHGHNIKQFVNSSIRTAGKYPNLNSSSVLAGFLCVWYDTNTNRFWILPKSRATLQLTLKVTLTGGNFSSTKAEAWDYNGAGISKATWGGDGPYSFPTNPPNTGEDKFWWGNTANYFTAYFYGTGNGDSFYVTTSGTLEPSVQCELKVESNASNTGFDRVVLGSVPVAFGFGNVGQYVKFTLGGQVLEVGSY